MSERVVMAWRYIAIYWGREGHGGRWRYLYWSTIIRPFVTGIYVAIALFLAGYIVHAGWSWQP